MLTNDPFIEGSPEKPVAEDTVTSDVNETGSNITISQNMSFSTTDTDHNITYDNITGIQNNETNELSDDIELNAPLNETLPPEWKEIPSLKWKDSKYNFVIDLWEYVIDMDTLLKDLVFMVIEASSEEPVIEMINGNLVISSMEMGSYWFILRVTDGYHEDETILVIEEYLHEETPEQAKNSSALELGEKFIDFIFAHLPEIIIIGIILMVFQGVYTMLSRRRS